MREAKIVRKYKYLLSDKNNTIKDLKNEIYELEYIQKCLVDELEDIKGKSINVYDYIRYR